MQDLVKASGMSKGAFYHYFKSKKELYEQSLEKFMLGFVDEMKVGNSQYTSLKDFLKEMFGKFAYLAENIQQTGDEGGNGISAYILIMQSALQQPNLRDKFREFGESYNYHFSQMLKKAMESGEIRDDLDPAVLTHHISSIMEGLVLIYSFGIEMESLNGTFTKIIDQLFDLIENKKAISDEE